MLSDMAAEGSLFPAAARAKLTALGGVNVVCLIGLLTGIGKISKQTRARLLYQARTKDSRDKTYSIDSHDSMSVLRCRSPPSTTLHHPPNTALHANTCPFPANGDRFILSALGPREYAMATFFAFMLFVRTW